jgi:dolichol kinase
VFVCSTKQGEVAMKGRGAVLLPMLVAIALLILILSFSRIEGGQQILLLAIGVLLGSGVVGVKLTEQSPRGRKALVAGLWGFVVAEVVFVAAVLALLTRAVRFMH